MKKTILILGSLLLAGSLSAQWVKIDDLESYDVDQELMDDPWTFYRSADENYAVLPEFKVVADPFGGDQGNVLSLFPGVPATQGNTTLERALPEEAIIKDPFPDEGKATFYFKVARPIVEGSPGEADTTWGLVSEAARDETTMQHAYGSYSVLGRIEIDGIIDIRDGGDYIDLTDEAIETQTWYEFWFVVDHSANTFTQYIKGGSDFPEQTKLQPEDAEYRFATFEDLETILLITTTGTESARKGKDPTYFDDFHVDPNTENLTSPDEENGGGATAGKFVNISTRGFVGTEGNVLIGGFVIGEDAQQVLVQAVGPELADAGVEGALEDPTVEIFNSASVSLAVNDNWEDTQGQMISDLWGGSPPLAAGSASSGIVITLEPGAYTAIVSGVGETEGVALIEVYQID